MPLNRPALGVEIIGFAKLIWELYPNYPNVRYVGPVLRQARGGCTTLRTAGTGSQGWSVRAGKHEKAGDPVPSSAPILRCRFGPWCSRPPAGRTVGGPGQTGERSARRTRRISPPTLHRCAAAGPTGPRAPWTPGPCRFTRTPRPRPRSPPTGRKPGDEGAATGDGEKAGLPRAGPALVRNGIFPSFPSREAGPAPRAAHRRRRKTRSTPCRTGRSGRTRRRARMTVSRPPRRTAPEFHPRHPVSGMTTRSSPRTRPGVVTGRPG